jgi:maltose alpha-D-glucosyltransferase/alpha-amylase
MYRVYAHEREARINLGIRRRLAPLLGNDRAKIELMNGLLLSLPGTPVIYYGDEIGMGDNIYLGDRDGVRTPMQWSGDRNAGFSRTNPQRLFLPTIIDPEFHYEKINVETQADNPQSLLWWMRRVLALRKRYPVFGRGELEFLQPDNRRVLAYLRRDEDHVILIVANLSRYAQYVELDLSEFKGRTPVELFGHTPFPLIGDLTYLLTLGPHAVYWLALEDRQEAPADGDGGPPRLAPPRTLDDLFTGRGKAALESALVDYLPTRRWFAGKARVIRGVSVRDAVPVAGPRSPLAARVVIVDVDFAEGEGETYAAAIGLYEGERAERLLQDSPNAIVARLDRRGEAAVLADATTDPEFNAALLDAVRRRRRMRGNEGQLAGRPTAALRAALEGVDEGALEPHVSRAEQSNTSIIYGNRLILKLFRRLEMGVNPDLEVGRHLTERGGYEHTPAVAGAIEYQGAGDEPATLAIVHRFAPNEGDAWSYTLDTLGRFYERILTEGPPTPEVPLPAPGLLARARAGIPEEANDVVGSFLESARQIGRRTAELHNALAQDQGDPAFTPEPMTPHHLRSVYQSMRNLAGRNLGLLRKTLPGLPDRARDLAERVAADEPEILNRFQALLGRRITCARIRSHGDFHLGQVLFTGRDFLLLDFEGEPSRSLGDRRTKRTPLRDVAGMLRSFHYATFAAIREEVDRGLVDPESDTARVLEAWGAYWYDWVSAAFLGAYLETAAGAPYLPSDDGDLTVLLESSLLEKAVYELGYELNNRPDWVLIPLLGIRDLLGEQT